MKRVTGYIKTTILLAFLTSFVLGIGYLLGGTGGMQLALVFALVMNGAMYWFSDSIVLKMAGASPMNQAQHPEIVTMTKALSKKMGIPMPKLFISQDQTPNAFATGRSPSKGVVCVTQGLLSNLEMPEIEAVVAHELAHIKNYDTLISTVASVFSGAIASIADMAFWGSIFGGGQRDEENSSPLSGITSILMLILAPIMASMIQFAISRAREFEADKTAAETTRRPRNLASALLKIEQIARGSYEAQAPAVAALSIYSNLKGEGVMSLFSTHPPTAQRVKRLEGMRFGI
jgi:heat shock protein HtpX